MPLTQVEKRELVAEINVVAQNAISVIAAEYRGMSVTDMTALRLKARDAGVYLRVVRNTLSRRALEGTDFDCMKDSLTGPLFLAFSSEAPGAAARVLREFGKDNDHLKVKLVSIGGKLYDASHLEAVAKLPTRDEAISRLMFVMKEPVAKFVRTLQEPHAKFVRTVAAVRDQKQSA